MIIPYGKVLYSRLMNSVTFLAIIFAFNLKIINHISSLNSRSTMFITQRQNVTIIWLKLCLSIQKWFILLWPWSFMLSSRDCSFVISLTKSISSTSLFNIYFTSLCLNGKRNCRYIAKPEGSFHKQGRSCFHSLTILV